MTMDIAQHRLEEINNNLSHKENIFLMVSICQAGYMQLDK